MSEGKRYEVTIRSDCTISLPRDLLRGLGWRSGDNLVLTRVKAGVLIVEIESTTSLAKKPSV